MKYEVPEQVSEDNEMLNAVLHDAIRARQANDRQLNAARKLKAPSQIADIRSNRHPLDSEIVEYQEAGQKLYAQHRDVLHGEALNIAAEQGVTIEGVAAAPKDNVIPFPQAPGAEAAPVETPRSAAGQ